MTDIAVSGSDTIGLIEGIEGDNYTAHVRDFTRWLRTRKRRIEQQSIIDYFIELNNSSYAANTKRVKRQAVKKRIEQVAKLKNYSFMQMHELKAFLENLDHESATKAPEIANNEIGREKYLTRDQVERLIEEAGERTRYFIKFLWATACRVSELTSIRLDKCKVIGETVFIKILGKGNKEREIKIPLSLYNELREVFKGKVYLFETSRGNKYVRNMVSESIGAVSKRVLGRPFRAHVLRHSWGTRKIKQGVPLSYVSKYMGHSNVSITSAMYDHGAIEEEDLFNDLL